MRLGSKTGFQRYRLATETLVESTLEHFQMCIGKRIGKVALYRCDDYRQFAIVFDVLKPVQFEKLKVSISTLSEIWGSVNSFIYL